MDASVDAFAAVLAAVVGTPVVTMTPVGGGDVAEAFRVETADGTVRFAKRHLTAPPGFFATEADGLRWLGETGALSVPAVIAVGDDPAYLVLEWIDLGGGEPASDADFGRSLAALHGAGAPSFGRTDRRTTGSRRLPNEPTATWAEFYAENRLRPLARLAADDGALPATAVADLERVAASLDRYGAADESPARLHGDLWAGNRVVDTAGRSWLVDPAAHGGHREFDLAMMRLFGGFAPECFAAYAEVAPLADGWEERVALHQLAPLVVHAIKFGGSYGPATEQALSRLV